MLFYNDIFHKYVFVTSELSTIIFVHWHAYCSNAVSWKIILRLEILISFETNKFPLSLFWRIVDRWRNYSFSFFFFIVFSNETNRRIDGVRLIIQSSWRQWTPAEPIKSNRMQIDCIPSSEERLTLSPFSSPSTRILPKICGTSFYFISWNCSVKKALTIPSAIKLLLLQI